MRFSQQQYDAIVHRVVEGGTVGGEPVVGNSNMLVPYFLMAAHAYEELDDPFLTDECWDWICSSLDAHWDTIEHRHKRLIDRAALSTGTASYLAGKLPTAIRFATKHLLRDYSSPDEVVPRAAVADIGDLLGVPATSIEDLL